MTVSIDRALARVLCQRALKGELNYDELRNVWPIDVSTGQLLAHVREDLADGVGHFPATLFTRIPVWTEWERSFEYKALVADEALLAIADVPENALLQAREILMAKIEVAAPSDERIQADALEIVKRLSSYS